MPPVPQLQGVFRTDLRARAAYAEGAGIYRILPAAVARPADEDDLGTLVRWAEATGAGLIPRGAGSGIPGGSVGPGVILDLRDLPRVLDIDPARATARTSANVTLSELNAAAQPHGLRLPPDPSSGAWATLGGMVATNASGARSLRYGSVRSWVKEVEVVGSGGSASVARRLGGSAIERPSGASESFRAARPYPSRTVEPRPSDPQERESATRERESPLGSNRLHSALHTSAALIRARFPRTRKNSSGYALDAWLDSGDLLDLLIGSEGTLGVITAITWRLDPIPAARSGLLVSLGSLDDLEPAVRSLNGLDPSAIELLDRTFLDLVSQGERRLQLPAIPAGTQAMLLIEFERGGEKEVRGAVGDAVRMLAPIATDVTTAITAGESDRLWALRHAASPILAGLPADRRSMQVIEDGCVPLTHLGEYVRSIREAASAFGLTVVIFGHAGDGNVHVNVLPELARPDWAERVAGLYEAVNSTVLRLGGTLTGEHGDGRLRAGWLERQYGSEIVGLFRMVKTDFDPHGIFNPGVILADPAPALRHLKVGPGAEPLPYDIAEALREIEKTAGYAVDRLEIADGEQGKGKGEKEGA